LIKILIIGKQTGLVVYILNFTVFVNVLVQVVWWLHTF
jgi:hypothetical protein